MGKRDTYQRAILNARSIAGDETRLAARLNRSVPEVVDWLVGTKPVPVRVFHACVDILNTEYRRRIDRNELFLSELRRRNEFLYPDEP